MTTINITYEGKNISRNIAPFLLSFAFTDNSDGAADDLTLQLHDKAALWVNSWMPTKGDKIQCSIVSEKYTLPCGKFEVDQIEYSAPPRVLSLKAISTAITRTLRSEKHNHSWENVKLSEIAADIAANGNVKLFYDADDYTLERREQSGQSDLEFLKSICSDYGLNVKVNDDKLIIYDAEQYEDKSSVTELNINDAGLISFKFTSKSAQTYKSARLKYHHPKKAQTYDVSEFDDDIEGSEQVLELNEYAESESDARKIAQKKLHKANSREITGNITLKGDTRLLAGVNISLDGFGLFSGKYFITKATHTVNNSGYITTLELSQGAKSKQKAKQRKKSKQAKGGAMLYYEGDKYYRTA